jgi:anti-sigma B factor antagonist
MGPAIGEGGHAVSSPTLRTAQETVGHAVVVRVSGDIDLLTAPELQQSLELACAEARPPGIVVADLTAVQFLGSSGLAVLMDVDKRCRAHDTPLRVVASTPVVARPLEVTGLDRILDVVGSLDSVIRSA